MDEPFMPDTEALYGPEAGSDNDSATADGGAEPSAGTGGRVRAYDPQAIADPAARRRAWERLYGFVEYLNSTWGALRNSRGVGDYYIRAGWWTNPIIVAHLAALQGEYAEAWLLDADRGAGATLMLRAGQGDLWRHTLPALLLAWAASALILLSSPFLYRVFGNRGLKAMERLMGMVLICISVQMLLNAFAHILH